MKSINPDPVRTALSEKYAGRKKFDLNEMADASECYELLLYNIQHYLCNPKEQ